MLRTRSARRGRVGAIMLQANTSTYMRLMQYGGYGIGWKYREMNNPAILVLNGIAWDSKSLGFTLYNAMSGVNSLSKTANIQTIPSIMHYATINASANSKQIIFSSRLQPFSGRQFNQVSWSTGLRKQSWANILKLQEEKTVVQDPALGKRSLLGIAFSTEKIFSNHASLDFAIWYNDIQQTKQTPTVLEAIRLSGNTNYHIVS